VLKIMARQMRESDNGMARFVGCCLECILQCIQDIVEYINSYAFTICAIYGKPYCEAVSDTMMLFSTNGFDLIINDDIIENLLFLGALACGAVGAGSGYLVTINASQNDQIISAVAGFIIGVGIMCIVNATIVSCVKSLFMCFAMDPLVLYNTKQSQYDKLMAAWSRRWPEGIPCQAYIDVATQSPQQAYGQQQQYSQQAQYGQVQPGTMPGSPSHYTAYDHTYAPTGGGAQAAPPPPPPYNPYANNPNAA